MTDRVKTVERVRRLLAMANDASSPNEAAIAARRARKMMDEHSLTQADVEDLEAGNGTFAEVRAGKARRFIAKWEQWLMVSVASLNDCIVRRKPETYTEAGTLDRAEFCGEEIDARVAASMYEYLCDTIKRLCSEYMAEQGYTRYNAKVGDSYKTGAAQAIRDKIKDILDERQKSMDDERTGTSLVVIKQEIVAQHYKHPGYGKSSKKAHRDPAVHRARQQGIVDGSRVSVNAQIGE